MVLCFNGLEANFNGRQANFNGAVFQWSTNFSRLTTWSNFPLKIRSVKSDEFTMLTPVPKKNKNVLFKIFLPSFPPLFRPNPDLPWHGKFVTNGVNVVLSNLKSICGCVAPWDCFPYVKPQTHPFCRKHKAKLVQIVTSHFETWIYKFEENHSQIPPTATWTWWNPRRFFCGEGILPRSPSEEDPPGR